MVAQDGLDLELGRVGVNLPLALLLGVRHQGLLARARIGRLAGDDAGGLRVEPGLGITLELEQARVLLARAVSMASLMRRAVRFAPSFVVQRMVRLWMLALVVYGDKVDEAALTALPARS